ncbi:MAG TPA: ATP-binding protein, partial [Ktedonobacteraceae bacterium]|nr:ATP-binding protein [Ktedonobacteraceae bacterium]
LITSLQEKFGTLPGGPWPESPDTALVLPLKAPEQHQVTGFLVVGVNPRRVLDEAYSDFFQMVAGHVATSVANARAYEKERKRAEALAELDQAKTLFFSNISHEFRTPLTLMLGPVEDLLASSQALSLAQHECIELLRRNMLRLLRLVNTLLDFSRMEAGRMEAVYEPIDLAAFTTDLASNFRSAIEKAGMTLHVLCPSELPLVYVDQQMWEKIMLNLLSNAFKYTFHGMIMVRLERKGSAVEVSVQDTGVGIPAEALPHMFERFHRVKGTQGRTFEGTGIGLSLVYELVKLHGGTIHVTSTLGQGSTFTISLPLGTAHLPPERLVARKTLDSTSVSVSTYVDEALQLLSGQETTSDLPMDIPLIPAGRELSSPGAQEEQRAQQPVARILFADDNADMRAYVGRLLQQHYDVLTALDGKAALMSVQQSHPDLIVADVMMPGMDGFALLQALRANQETRTIPVILLSARAGEEARVEGLQAGADDYLIKPFSRRELLARVGAHLEMARIRKQAEKRVKGERQKLYDLFMQAPAIICVLRGPTHIYELVNPLYAQLVGRCDLLGKPIREARPELEKQGIYELLDQVYTTGEPFIGNEVRVEREREQSGSSEEGYFNFVYQPIHTPMGEVEGIMVLAVDVTEQVRSRQQMQTFLGVASHELKNPLTAIKGNIDLAQRRLKTALLRLSEGNEKVRPVLEDISQKLTHANQQIDFQNRLISDLVDTTRIETGKLELCQVLEDLNAVVRDAVEEQRHLMPTRTIHLNLMDEEPLLLLMDVDRMKQVVTNYLSNALKYSEAEQEVWVNIEATEREIRVSIRDQGTGLDVKEQAHIWERFYRAPGISVKSGSGIGLGLGLYICRTIIEGHGGRVGVESVKGAGATFWFALPSRSQLELSNSLQLWEEACSQSASQG